MPRGQKSKLRARKKRCQTQEETLEVEGDQATAAVEEESIYSSSPHFKSTPQALPAAGSCTNPTITSDVAVFYTRANEDVNHQERLSSRQAQTTTQKLYKDKLEIKVIILVYYLLYKYQMKELVTKAEIMKNIIQFHKNHYSEILRRASENLELIFGLDLKEIDPNRHIYVLINKLELSCDGNLSDDRGMPKTGILMTVLGVIFTKGNCATEEQVWEVLNALGLYAGKNHFFFGEPRMLITRDMVMQKYLEYQQVPNSDPPNYEFLWGPRAHAETSKMKVLEFWAKVHNTIPCAFPFLYEEALEDEEARARARVEAKAQISAIASARSKATPSKPKSKSFFFFK
ncbi:melanoma-associated antigen B10-like [Orycteropus afer afer]|uniref:Melanoma-associated antigen B10-like n=1 Tax=Orycteropus afer afer TaxID=1230840 RepID=A0A8B7B8Y9_ORYAF|nr:melanoma-associated antigen B10-like [Orycteropus afer afer]